MNCKAYTLTFILAKFTYVLRFINEVMKKYLHLLNELPISFYDEAGGVRKCKYENQKVLIILLESIISRH